MSDWRFIQRFNWHTGRKRRIYFQYVYHNNTQKKLQNLSTFRFTDEENRAHGVKTIKKNKTNGNYHHLVDEKIEVEKNSRITIEENNKNHQPTLSEA